MKSTFKQLFRPSWMNVVKILSLTLGFAVSVALMCRIAWYQSFDNFWEDVGNLQILEQQHHWLTSGEKDLRIKCFPGLAPTIASGVASVEAATRFHCHNCSYVVNDVKWQFLDCYVDSSFFDVLKIKMVTGGNPKEILKNRGNAIISEAAAKILFPDGNILGQIIKNETDIYTVSGVFKDIPENSFIPEIDLIAEKDIPMFFTENDEWFTLLRTHKNTKLQEVNKEVKEYLEPIYKDAPAIFGVKISFQVTNIHDYSQRQHFDLLSWIVVFVLLLISGLNFALLTISSLVSRAKEVGVRKAAGSKASGIFSLIIWETTIYVLLSALLAGVLLWGLKPQLDEMFDKFENIFAFENLWGVAVVIGALILFAGVLPAWIFSRIPVTQVFQRFVSNRLLWKRILLFLQFTASTFVICLMFIFLKQYQTSINYNYGYEPNKLIRIYLEHLDETVLHTIVSEISTDSRVESVNVCSRAIWYGLPGTQVTRDLDEENVLNVCCLNTDSNFFKVHGIKILQGDNNLTGTPKNAGNVVVNQAFLNTLQIEGNPLEEVFYNLKLCPDGHIERTLFTITGICQNFESLEDGVEPLVITARDTTEEICQIIIRVNEVTPDLLDMIREKVILCCQDETLSGVGACSENIFRYFHGLRLGGNIAIFATICLLLITIMGILSYVNLEIRRRTKEIAIRKIHGSTAIEVIWKISRDLLLMAFLATPIAITTAFLFGIRWQQGFIIKTELSWYLFAGAALIVVLTIAVCATLQTWRTANANPARGLSSE
jgi:putative ABC transport system permease protein